MLSLSARRDLPAILTEAPHTTVILADAGSKQCLVQAELAKAEMLKSINIVPFRTPSSFLIDFLQVTDELSQNCPKVYDCRIIASGNSITSHRVNISYNTLYNSLLRQQCPLGHRRPSRGTIVAILNIYPQRAGRGRAGKPVADVLQNFSDMSAHHGQERCNETYP